MGFEPVMEEAAKATSEIDFELELDDHQVISRSLYHILVQVVEGKAHRILRSTPRGNGAEAWRRLKAEYQPMIAQRRLALLHKLMNPDLTGTDDQFEDKFAQWERSVYEYETTTAKPFDSELKLAVLLRCAPTSIRQHLQLNASTFEQNWEKLRTVITLYLQTRRQFVVEQAPVPMEIGYLGGKSSGKGKFGGKGKTSQSSFGQQGWSPGKGAHSGHYQGDWNNRSSGPWRQGQLSWHQGQSNQEWSGRPQSSDTQWGKSQGKSPKGLESPRERARARDRTLLEKGFWPLRPRETKRAMRN